MSQAQKKTFVALRAKPPPACSSFPPTGQTLVRTGHTSSNTRSAPHSGGKKKPGEGARTTARMANHGIAQHDAISTKSGSATPSYSSRTSRRSRRRPSASGWLLPYPLPFAAAAAAAAADHPLVSASARAGPAEGAREDKRGKYQCPKKANRGYNTMRVVRPRAMDVCCGGSSSGDHFINISWRFAVSWAGRKPRRRKLYPEQSGIAAAMYNGGQRYLTGCGGGGGGA